MRKEYEGNKEKEKEKETKPQIIGSEMKVAWWTLTCSHILNCSIVRFENAMNTEQTTIRLNKYLAHHGISARRDIKDVLKAHTVTVNGKKVTEPGIRIDPRKDIVLFDGKKLIMPAFVYYLLNKPRNVVSTVSDEFGRKTVVSLIPTKERLYPVGRLDQNTTGLILLTNDGDLANYLTHPRYHIAKTYRLVIKKNVSEEKLEKFRTGVLLEDGTTAPAQARIVKKDEGKTIIEVVIHEGKKRQIRRMCEALHMDLLELQRIALGPLIIGNLKLGEWRELTSEEVARLKQ